MELRFKRVFMSMVLISFCIISLAYCDELIEEKKEQQLAKQQKELPAAQSFAANP